MGSALKKADKALQDELNKQLGIIYPSAIIVLWNDYGWRKLRISRRLLTSQQLWEECAAHGTDKSMMQMLEDETGIEIRMTGCDNSFHEFSYLDGTKWDGRIPTPAEAVYIKHRMLKWIAPQIMACLCLTMYRDEHMSIPKIAELINKVDAFRNEHGNNPKEYTRMMQELTGLTEKDIRG